MGSARRFATLCRRPRAKPCRRCARLSRRSAPLYKALHRLERQGFVRAEWGLSENNRRARFYELTPVGRKQLRADVTTWRRYAEAVFKVLDPARA